MGFSLKKTLGYAWTPNVLNSLTGHDKEKKNPLGSGANLPKFAMRNTNEFMQAPEQTKIARTVLPGSQANEAMAKRYSQMRERTSQDVNASADKSVNALNRRFTAMGSSGSGAQMKLQQQTLENAERTKQDSMREIDANEAAEAAQRDDARAMAQAQMDQQTTLAQADMDFRNKVFSFERGSKLHELDLAERQQQVDTATTEFNSRVAAESARPKKGGFLSSLMDTF
jgi:hypothetical protein